MIDGDGSRVRGGRCVRGGKSLLAGISNPPIPLILTIVSGRERLALPLVSEAAETADHD